MRVYRVDYLSISFSAQETSIRPVPLGEEEAQLYSSSARKRTL
jgi:hypothetical protein